MHEFVFFRKVEVEVAGNGFSFDFGRVDVGLKFISDDSTYH